MYKLPDRLRLHPAQAITLRASTHIQGKETPSIFNEVHMGLTRRPTADVLEARYIFTDSFPSIITSSYSLL